jgi:dTDP-4-amino-4,6-dideoxygalactose transaminase
MKIPFNRFVKLPEHADFLGNLDEIGNISSGGPYSRKVENELNRIYSNHSLLVPSATAALEMMPLLTNLKEGDEVILPSYTFVSTANAFLLRGIVPRFADIDWFGNLKPTEIERLSNQRTKAVCVVHYGGNSADMDLIVEICKNKHLILFEDAAQCIGSFYKGRPLGSIGSLSCLSFHETKNLTSGEGGALLINDKSFLNRSWIIRDKGTNRRDFLNGQIDKYTWVDIGSSYCLSDLNAMYLYPQILKLNQITKARGLIWRTYQDQLAPIFEKLDFKLIDIPSHNTPNYHLFGFVTKTSEQRSQILKSMKKEDVQATSHYMPLHTSPFGRQFKTEHLSVTEALAEGIVRLPLWFNMSQSEIDFVVSKTKKVLAKL